MYAFAFHNFTENFLNAEGYGDNFMSAQMLLDELAKLVVDNKQQVVKIMREHGFNATMNDDKIMLSKKLFDAISKNEDLREEVSDVIVENNVDEANAKNIIKSFAGKVLNASGFSLSSEFKSVDWASLSKNSDVKNGVKDLVNKGLAGLSGTPAPSTGGKPVTGLSGTPAPSTGGKPVTPGKGTNAPTAEENLSALQQKVKLADSTSNKSKGMSTGTKIAIAVVVVAGISTGLFFILRKKQQGTQVTE